MPKHAPKPLKPRDIYGVKYLERLLPLLDELHEVGCQRDKAGNRNLHYDQYCLFVLLLLFNPLLRSLRALQQASTLQNVQRKLGCARTSLGSLSEAVEVFDPERLCGIIAALATEVKRIRHVRRGRLTHTLTAVDGSVVKTLKSIAEAVFMSDKNGGSHSGWRLHTHFDIDRHVPTRMEVTPACNSGHNDEKTASARRCSPIIATSWTAGTLSSPSGMRSSPSAAVTSAGSATTAISTRSSKNALWQRPQQRASSATWS